MNRVSNNNKSEAFSITIDREVNSGQTVNEGNRRMRITKIKHVKITEDGKLLVEGLWKEDEVSRMLRKFGR